MIKEVEITQLTPEFAVDLVRHSYFSSARQRGDVLNHGLGYRIKKAIKLFPRATRLVAYQTEKKKAIGFLYLEENNEQLYTIEYLFVDSEYRKMGIATRLMNYAMTLAKEKGAKKVNLNVSSSSIKAIELYRRMGFKTIGNTLLVQGYLNGFAPLHFMKRIFLGQGCLAKLALEKNGRLVELEMNSRKNREMLFEIYRDCMSQEWIDFFEVTADNLMNGTRHVWQTPFFKDALIDNFVNSFALVFNSPLSSKTTVELFVKSDADIQSMLKDLLRVLANRGVSFFQIHLFNPESSKNFQQFREKEIKTLPFLAMGKTLI